MVTSIVARLKLYSTDRFKVPLPEGHKFPVEKYSLVRKLLEDKQLFDITPAPPVQPETLAVAHDPAYIGAFLSGTLSAASMRRIGLPWSEILVKRSLASVGGTLSAARDALRTGWGGTLGGGTHHAFRAEGAGFCVFNDIAVAARVSINSGSIRRAAVIDLDVHQGDGTAEIFENDPNVFTLSIHCQSNFPFRKKKSSLDVAVRDKVEDEEYLRLLDQALPEVFAFNPDLVFYQSGVDGLATDVLGRLALTHAGLQERDRKVMLAVRERGIPLVLTSGGGYSRPIELSAQAHVNTYTVAAEVFAETVAERECSSSDR